MKKFISFILAVMLCFGAVVLSACNEQTRTSADVYGLYIQMRDEEAPDGFLSVSINTSKVVPAGRSVEEDKAQVFGGVYAHYLDCASGFFFSVFERKGTPEFLNHYSGEQLSTLYNKLSKTYSTLKALKKEIYVYEASDGNLNYKQVVTKYNLLIDKFFDLSFYFANLYYTSNSFNLSNYTTLSASGTNLNDFLWYELCVMARVSFGYELINYVYSNPLGDITDWLNRSVYVKGSIAVAKRLSAKLKQHNNNLTDYLASSGMSSAFKTLCNMQSNRECFLKSYNLFLSAKHSVDLKAYLGYATQAERNAYLNSLTNESRSYFRIVFNFLQDDYDGYLVAFKGVADYIYS